MFDPTVFDNLKTVLEGAVYDLDLEGVILVINRNDLVDLAHFSRTYKITFQLREYHAAGVTCTIALQTKLEHIAGELLGQNYLKPGCILEIAFHMPVKQSETTCFHIKEALANIWGSNRIIRQTLTHEYQGERKEYDNQITIEFDRLIDEGNVDDLQAMIPYVIESLRQLQPFYGM
ncbi:hypothetical protein B0I26_10882 [Anoxybacillus vitaminiphilus]|uniref:Uncharacterized protein n=1 Tax=Paranoxybacillus vitaminiphilus TaxID=581036 RepID=A0A327YEI2_9BACL|nr:hypothetical protein [Anoxybacillus vitaminiphilus]RAK18907.1 hypothetical protein B0I26_10882 [Anoxybacillus vitaminiphilus]